MTRACLHWLADSVRDDYRAAAFDSAFMDRITGRPRPVSPHLCTEVHGERCRGWDTADRHAREVSAQAETERMERVG